MTDSGLDPEMELLSGKQGLVYFSILGFRLKFSKSPIEKTIDFVGKNCCQCSWKKIWLQQQGNKASEDSKKVIALHLVKATIGW